MAVVSTQAVLLRSHPYSETSQILRFFTQSHGLVGVMAKGQRKRGGKGSGAAPLFARGVLVFYHKGGRDLHTLKSFHSTRATLDMGSQLVRFAAASVLAELLLKHSSEGGHPELFTEFNEALDRLREAPEPELVSAALSEVWTLVCALGYQPHLDTCVISGRPLGPDEVGRFDFSAGGVRGEDYSVDATGPRLGPGARQQLLRLLEPGTRPELNRPRAHLKLLGEFIQYHVAGGTPLKSIGFLAGLIPEDEG